VAGLKGRWLLFFQGGPAVATEKKEGRGGIPLRKPVGRNVSPSPGEGEKGKVVPRRGGMKAIPSHKNAAPAAARKGEGGHVTIIKGKADRLPSWWLGRGFPDVDARKICPHERR